MKTTDELIIALVNEPSYRFASEILYPSEDLLSKEEPILARENSKQPASLLSAASRLGHRLGKGKIKSIECTYFIGDDI